MAKCLVDKYGSPLYVFDERKFLGQIERIRSAFSQRYPNFQLAYSIKTNYLPYVCKLAFQQKVIAEIIPGFEYDIAKKIGYFGKDIIVNGPYKTEAQLEAYAKDGCMINIDNIEELKRLEKLAKGRKLPLKIGIRVNARIGNMPWSKFGFSIEEGAAKKAAKAIKMEKNLILAGIHMHIGTDIKSPYLYREAIDKILLLASNIEKELGIGLEYIDLGGGFPSKGACPDNELMEDWGRVPEIEEFAEAICSPLSKAYFGRKQPKLFVEPGRFLVDESFSVLTKAITTKSVSKLHLVFVDGGVNIVPSAMYRKHKLEIHGPIREKVMTEIHGPLCMQVDRLFSRMMLPKIETGDLIEIKTTGAYELSQSMQFIAERPPVVAINKDGSKIIRRKETWKDITCRDLFQ